jgi:hypothetical protein
MSFFCEYVPIQLDGKSENIPYFEYEEFVRDILENSFEMLSINGLSDKEYKFAKFMVFSSLKYLYRDAITRATEG